MSETFLRLPQVMEKVGLRKTKIYAIVKEGSFPKPVRLSHRVAFWKLSEIEAWMRERG